MIRHISLFLLLLTAFTLFSCKGKQADNSKLQLTVSIIPQKYLASFIAGDKFEVQTMLPPGSNHETYEPSPRDMEKFATSKLYLALGALDFELTWLDRFKASNPSMQVINTSQGIQMLDGHIHEEHGDHKAESNHESHGIDPHIWLSPLCMKTQATNICNALCTTDSVHATYYKERLNTFIKLADSIDLQIRNILSGKEGKAILIFHPALGYFARDYSIEQISIEQEGKEPSAAHISELVKTASSKGIKSIFISKEFDTRHAEAIASEIHAKIVVIDPMAEDWPTNMIHIATLIANN